MFLCQPDTFSSKLIHQESCFSHPSFESSNHLQEPKDIIPTKVLQNAKTNYHSYNVATQYKKAVPFMTYKNSPSKRGFHYVSIFPYPGSSSFNYSKPSTPLYHDRLGSSFLSKSFISYYQDTNEYSVFTATHVAIQSSQMNWLIYPISEKNRVKYCFLCLLIVVFVVHFALSSHFYIVPINNTERWILSSFL